MGFNQISYAAPTPLTEDKFTFNVGQGADGEAKIALDGTTGYHVPVYYRDNDKNNYVFCVEHHAAVNNNTTYTKGGVIDDYGLLYLLNNSYASGKEIITEGENREYANVYITQTAIWLYLDETQNDSIHDLSEEEKLQFQQFMASGDFSESALLSLPENVLKKIIPTSTYEGVLVTTEDKIELLRQVDKIKETKSLKEIPTSIQTILLPSFTMDNIEISTENQLAFLEKLGTLDKDSSAQDVYKKVDEMPKSIKKLVEPTMNINKIKNITILLVILYVVSALFTYIESISMTDVANKFAKNLRSRISVKINKLPLK